MRALNITRNSVLTENLYIADSFIKRFKGLMGRAHLYEDESLLVVPCNSIHTFFMKFQIDVIFLDKDNIVLHVIEKMKKNKVSRIIKGAKKVLEMPMGSIQKSLTAPGDRIEILKS